mmetsp:Transcript_44741/g.50165  ORF Transcript_44741/g.50165 Transcript_44741/m.50165 type:complete len:103 (-) Transcript_44741:293-601(-)
MSKELANSIVLASHQMEHNEINEVISVVRFKGYINGEKYWIQQPTHMGFYSFEECYNHLSAKGYKQISPEKASRLDKLMKSGNTGATNEDVVMIMSKPVGNK